MSARRLALTALTLLVAIHAATAEEQKPAGAAGTVAMFDRYCYSIIPDLAAIEKHAGASGWTALEGEALAAYKPVVEPEVLRAWSFKEADAAFSLTITKTPMDDEAKKQFPEYADATSFACSLILPAGNIASADIAAEMKKLVTRDPDESYEEGPFKVSAWTGEAEKALVLLYHYAPKSGGPGGLLSLNVMQKP